MLTLVESLRLGRFFDGQIICSFFLNTWTESLNTKEQRSQLKALSESVQGLGFEVRIVSVWGFSKRRSPTGSAGNAVISGRWIKRRAQIVLCDFSLGH